MRKILIIAIILIATVGFGFSQGQKYGFVDTEYILSNIPTYTAAKKQLDEIAAKWELEVKAQFKEVEEMYKKYQTEKVLLSDEMKSKREEEIINKEKSANELKKGYFGADGELQKKRKELVKPIQDEVYNAIKKIAKEGNFTIIFDIASNPGILYTDPKYDKSYDVLEKLGYKTN